MDPSQTSSTQPILSEPPTQLIRPSQVWTNLSRGQQHHLLQTIVLVCRERLVPAGYAQVKEVPHD
jgi:hypothetical protein